jgi:hypothetical protein
MLNIDKTKSMGIGKTSQGSGGCCERRMPSDFVGGRIMCRRGRKPSRSRARRVGTGMFAVECCMGSDAVPVNQNEKVFLETSIKYHQDVIDEMKARLEELEKK